MAATTFDSILAGMQPHRGIFKGLSGTLVAGRPLDTWALAGAPGAGSYDTSLNGVALSSTSAQVAGQIPFSDPTGGAYAYLARLLAGATVAGTLLLCDRLWHNGGLTITSTSPQGITSPTFPARDNNGATAGDGVQLMLVISANAGAAAPTITVSYTNEAGTSGRTGTNIHATANSPLAGSAFFLGLQAGDKGVKSVESLTLSTSWISGTMNLVAFRILAQLEIPAAATPNSIDALTAGLPRLYPGSVPFFIFIPSTTTTSNIWGEVAFTWA